MENELQLNENKVPDKYDLLLLIYLDQPIPCYVTMEVNIAINIVLLQVELSEIYK